MRGMLALLQEASNEIPVGLQKLEAWATIFQGFLTPLLIATGGFFAWYKFIRQGEHDPRLQPSITATTTIHDGTVYLFATATVQNTGQVDVEFKDEGSALTIFTTTVDADDWQPQLPESVFRGQRCVRPGETLEDQKLIQIDYGNEIAVRLDLAVTAGEAFTWNTIEIVSLLPDQGGK
jgi:hypothetical protein